MTSAGTGTTVPKDGGATPLPLARSVRSFGRFFARVRKRRGTAPGGERATVLSAASQLLLPSVAERCSVVGIARRIDRCCRGEATRGTEGATELARVRPRVISPPATSRDGHARTEAEPSRCFELRERPFIRLFFLPPRRFSKIAFRVNIAHVFVMLVN